MDEQKIGIVNYTYKLEELVDQMHNSVANADKIISEQQELINVIESSEKHEVFESFTKELKSSIKDQSAKIADCKNRVILIEKLIEVCKDDMTKATAITVCCLLLEGLAIERRPESKAEEKEAA